MKNNNLQIKDTLTNAHIMVVDDINDNLVLVRDVLSTQDYSNITLVQDPTTVIDLYQDNPVDLFLIDLNMPVMDGFSLIQALQDLNDPFLPPMLVLTAQTASDYRQRALNQGARDYITKPFDFSELTARVRNHLEIRQAQVMLREQNEVLEQKVHDRTKELRHAHDQLKESHNQVIRKLGMAAEYRDNETGLHIIRMSKICVILGKAAGLMEEELELLLNASPMHDIGKIGIPDRVLLKENALESDEWDIMKTHTEIGAHILSGDDSPLMDMAKNIALTHHEKWDGSGYPQGLKGEEIPMVARICSLADVFDALTSRRPYKEAWSIDDALEYTRENSGKHFDPELVNLLLENIGDITHILERYTDPK